MIAAAQPVQTNRYKVWCSYGSHRGPSISTSLLLHSFTCYTSHLTSHCPNYANVPTSPTFYPAAHHLDCLALWFNTRRTYSSTAERPRGFLLVRLWCTSIMWRVISAARKWQNSGQPCNECALLVASVLNVKGEMCCTSTAELLEVYHARRPSSNTAALRPPLHDAEASL